MERSVVCKRMGGKLVKVAVRAEGGLIKRARITGDFFVHPEGAVEALEVGLIGKGSDQIGEAVRRWVGGGVMVIGFNPEDLIIMIEECLR